jgi:hypothetical protein
VLIINIKLIKMKKLFTIGFVASAIAVSMFACTKNNSVNPASNSLSTFVKKDTVTPPQASITLKDNVTPPAKSLNSLSPLLKRDTVTPPRNSFVKRDTVTPPHAAIAIRDTVTPPRR